MAPERRTQAGGRGASRDGLNEAVDWLAVCRRTVEAHRGLFAANPGISERTVFEGIGEGGDMALALDRRCEDAVFEELQAVHEAGADFLAISEERGEVAFGDSGSAQRVVIDPIDGSLNARRTIPTHCLSIAVARGPAMGDVEFGYVYDFGASEEFVARRGKGAELNGHPLHAEGPGRGIEVVGVESAQPDWILPVIEHLHGKAWRIRAPGSIAISLAYVGAGRYDAMLTARGSRSVDAAAAQLVAREAGAVVQFEGYTLDDAPLSIEARYRLIAGLDDEMVATLGEGLPPVEDPPS